MIYDFHTHSFLSDGVLSPVELIRRALVNQYEAIAITDHAGPGNMRRVIAELIRECQIAEKYWKITAIPGVELTHVPAGSIAELAEEARQCGAQLVVVHGETLVEPVEPGTNLAAVSCKAVDILAHPGLLNSEEAELAVKNDIFIEITSRGGHNTSNGHVARVGREAGVKFLVNSDTHEPGNLLTDTRVRNVALGSGLLHAELDKVIKENPFGLLQRIESRRRV